MCGRALREVTRASRSAMWVPVGAEGGGGAGPIGRNETTSQHERRGASSLYSLGIGLGGCTPLLILTRPASKGSEQIISASIALKAARSSV